MATRLLTVEDDCTFVGTSAVNCVQHYDTLVSTITGAPLKAIATLNPGDGGPILYCMFISIFSKLRGLEGNLCCGHYTSRLLFDFCRKGAGVVSRSQTPQTKIKMVEIFLVDRAGETVTLRFLKTEAPSTDALSCRGTDRRIIYAPCGSLLMTVPFNDDAHLRQMLSSMCGYYRLPRRGGRSSESRAIRPFLTSSLVCGYSFRVVAIDKPLRAITRVMRGCEQKFMNVHFPQTGSQYLSNHAALRGVHQISDELIDEPPRGITGRVPRECATHRPADSLHITWREVQAAPTQRKGTPIATMSPTFDTGFISRTPADHGLGRNGCHEILFIYEAVVWSRSFQTSACELLAYRNFLDPYSPTSLALLWVISRRSFFEVQIVDEAGGCKWVHNVAISSWKFIARQPKQMVFICPRNAGIFDSPTDLLSQPRHLYS
ncbi:hypothetical protein B0H11DRAFT_1933041 [Mycena galericulata]|nr:hypothetical protein B0H11DRAFT_1933041 [Mycena galericulata]